MKRIRRYSPEEKKKLGKLLRSRANLRLPKETRRVFQSDVPVAEIPDPDGIGEFSKYAENACIRIGVPHERPDVGVFHHVGFFTGSSSLEALDEFVHTYNLYGDVFKYIFHYEEYLDAIKRVGRIQAQLDAIDKHRESEQERWHKHCEKYDAWVASESDKPSPTYYEKKEPEPPSQRDAEFLEAYNLTYHTSDKQGFINYIRSLAPILGEYIEKPIPLYLKEDSDKPHGYVLGTPGSGKSELLKLFIHTFTTHHDYGSVVVIDPTSDFTNQIAKWKEFNASDRLIYIKPTLAKGMTPVINPFEINGVRATDYSEDALNVKRVVAQELTEAIGHVVTESNGSLSGPMINVIRNCILVLLDRPDSTLEDLCDFMNPDKCDDLVEFAKSLKHHDRLPGYFDSKSSGFNLRANTVTKDAVFRRIDGLLQTGSFKRFTCGKSTLDLVDAVENKKVILFDLARGAIGQDESSAIGRLIIAILLGMAYRRAETKKRDRVPVSLVIDECQNFITQSMTSILNDTRKYRLMMTLSQQVAGQFMPIDLKESLLQTTSMQAIGGTTRSGAKRNADLVGVEQKDVETLKVGEFWVKPDRPSSPLKFKTRTDLLDDANSVTPGVWRLTRQEQIERYYIGNVKKADLEFEEDPDVSPQEW